MRAKTYHSPKETDNFRLISRKNMNYNKTQNKHDLYVYFTYSVTTHRFEIKTLDMTELNENEILLYTPL